MSRLTDKAMALRSDPALHCNCAQTILRTFAEDLHLDEEMMNRLGSNFGGGMKMGGTCGAITSGAMILGLFGMDNPRILNGFYQKIRDSHDGLTDCAALLQRNMEKGGQKKPHCDAMICESITYIEEILQEQGLRKEE